MLLNQQKKSIVETFCKVVETFCKVVETFCKVVETFCKVVETFLIDKVAIKNKIQNKGGKKWII